MKIDKNVPLPTKGRGTKFPWAEMEPGDSFFAAGYSVVRRTGVPQMHTNPGKIAIPGSQWTLRTVTEAGVLGVRVWRVK